MFTLLKLGLSTSQAMKESVLQYIIEIKKKKNFIT